MYFEHNFKSVLWPYIDCVPKTKMITLGHCYDFLVRDFRDIENCICELMMGDNLGIFMMSLLVFSKQFRQKEILIFMLTFVWSKLYCQFPLNSPFWHESDRWDDMRSIYSIEFVFPLNGIIWGLLPISTLIEMSIIRVSLSKL